MRIALRVFLSYLLLTLLLGVATLFAAWKSIGHLVTGVKTEAAVEMGREIGLFLTSSGSFDALTPEETRRVQKQIESYVERSERLDSLIIVDNDGRIRFASDAKVVGRIFHEGADRDALLSKKVSTGEFGPLWEITVPLESHIGGRIGAMRVRITPDYYREFLLDPPRDALWIFGGMVLFIALTGVVLASLLTIPIRRLNRTLTALQAGAAAAQVQVDERSDFAPALRVVRGLGERLEALAASSRSSELILSRITEALVQGVLVVDGAGHPTSVNEPALRMLGADPRPGEGPQQALELLSSDPRLAEPLARAARGEEIGSLDLPACDGRPGLRIASFLLHESGAPAGAILLLSELDTARALETYLQEAGRLSLLARLHSSVMHEIKNPLQAMVVNVEAMRTRLDSVPLEKRAAFERNIDVTVREIYHMNDVIRDYLGLAAESDPDATAIVSDVVDNVLDLLGYEAGKRSIRLLTDIAPSLPKAPLPAVRLKQALLNLCLNSIQAMETGGTLTIRGRPAEGALCLEVSDTGPGIPQAVRGSIFDFHFTTKSRGSGLGLPIVRTIVESVGGSIELESEPGRGATFRLRFPASHPARSAGAAGE